jgi:hypothetical protein
VVGAGVGALVGSEVGSGVGAAVVGAGVGARTQQPAEQTNPVGQCSIMLHSRKGQPVGTSVCSSVGAAVVGSTVGSAVVGSEVGAAMVGAVGGARTQQPAEQTNPVGHCTDPTHSKKGQPVGTSVGSLVGDAVVGAGVGATVVVGALVALQPCLGLHGSFSVAQFFVVQLPLSHIPMRHLFFLSGGHSESTVHGPTVDGGFGGFFCDTVT